MNNNKPNPLKIIIVLIVLAVIMILIGQMIGAFALMKYLHIEPVIKELRPWILFEYFQEFKDHRQAGQAVKIAFMASFAPAVLSMLLVLVVLLIKKSPMDTLHGDARFAKKHEIQKAGMAYTFNKKRNDKWPAVLLGQLDSKTYVCDASQEYTALAAPPGSGKGVSFVIPNLLNYPESILNFDPKSENFVITSGYRSKVLGQKIIRFSPDDKPLNDGDVLETAQSNAESHCWNPLDYINTHEHEILSDIRKMTALLIDAPDGQNQGFYLSARAALDGIILYLMESKHEEKTLYRAWAINNDKIGFKKWAAATIAEHGDSLTDQCKSMLMAYANEDERKQSTTKGIIDTALTVFTDAKTRAATSKSDFDFNDLRKQKISIFVCIAPTNIPRYQNMLNLFFSQALSVNTEVLPENDKSLKYQCLALLDEFVALGRIELIKVSSGYTRAYNMRYAIVFQNMAQVNSVYTQEGAQSLLETFHNSITFAVPSVKEAANVSARLGNKTIRMRENNRTKQSQGGSSTSQQWITQPRALMLPQEIQNLPYEEQIIFKGGGRVMPIHCKKIVYYKDKNFKNKANMETPKIPELEYVKNV